MNQPTPTPAQMADLETVQAAVTAFLASTEAVMKDRGSFVLLVDLHNMRIPLHYLTRHAHPDVVICAQIIEEGVRAFLQAITGAQVQLEASVKTKDELGGKSFGIDLAPIGPRAEPPWEPTPRPRK